ncbi:MAG: hypothetical protein IPM74_02315 [Crocinitomicaceae bacterium]|nr:hypothetical protein [Crocinitomicaceae bacterium]
MFISCDHTEELNDKTVNKEIDPTIEEQRIDTLPNSSELINYVDSDGLKQGKHVLTNSKGTVIKIENFQNDTLNGFYFNWSGIKEEGNMKNGKRDGIFFQYYNKKQILYIQNFKDDSLIYFVPYEANQSVVVPHKHLLVYVDSLYLEVNHPQGGIWYEGFFRNSQPVGFHKVYYESGNIRGTINYDLGTFDEFDSEGTKIIEDKNIPFPIKKHKTSND